MKQVGKQYKSNKDGKWHNVHGDYTQISVSMGLDAMETLDTYALEPHEVIVSKHQLMHWHDAVARLLNAGNDLSNQTQAQMAMSEMDGIIEWWNEQ